MLNFLCFFCNNFLVYVLFSETTIVLTNRVAQFNPLFNIAYIFSIIIKIKMKNLFFVAIFEKKSYLHMRSTP